MKHRKKIMCSFLVMLLALLSVTSAYAAYYDEGYNGMTEDKAYRINTLDDLKTLRDRVNAGTEPGDRYYKLTQDITTNALWYNQSIGQEEAKPFTGHFNGNGNTISISTGSPVFGVIDSDGTAVKYLNVKGAVGWHSAYTSDNNRIIGGIAGRLKSGTIENCNFSGQSVMGNYSGKFTAGGIVGMVNADGKVINCRVSGDVSAGSVYTSENYIGYAGGIVGILEGGTIEKCRVTINDSIYAFSGGSGGQEVNLSHAGGIAGYVSGESSKVNNCVVKGIVRSKQYAGGIVGYMQAGTLTNCYVLGDSAVEGNYISGSIAGYLGGDAMADTNMIELDSQVSAVSEAVGGVIGHLNSGTVTNNRAYTRVKGRAQYKGTIIGKATGSPNIISDNYYYSDSGASSVIGFDNSILGPNDNGGTTHTEEISDVIDPVDPDPLNPSPFKPNPPVITITIDTDAILPSGTVAIAYSQTLSATPSAVTWAVESGSLPNGLELSTAGVISGTPTLAGSFKFTVRATSTNGVNSVSKEFTLAISPTPTPVLPLTIAPETAMVNVTAGASADVSFTAANNNGDVTWEVGPVPTGIMIEPSTTVAYATQYNTVMVYTVTAPIAVAGTYNVTVTAFDESGNSATATLNVEVSAPIVAAPVITTESLASADVGKEYSATIEATGDEPMIWMAEGLPEGLTFDSGTISGTPTTAGTYIVKVSVSNPGGYISESFTLEVVGGGYDPDPIVAPTITTSEDLGSYTAGYSVSIKLEATGTEPLTWAAEGLPEGLSITNDGLLFGTVESDDTYSFTATVSNSAGKDSKNFTIVMKKHIFINPAEVTTSTDLGEFKAGEKISIQIKATGTAPLTWMAENLPDGLNMSSAGLVYGAAMTTGTYSFTVAVSNAGGEVSRTFTLTIIPAVIPPSITTAQDLGTYGYDEGIERTIDATGTEPITWSASGLPSWLALDSETGSLSGITPSKRADASFTVTAANSAGKDSRKFTLTVRGNPAPAIPPTISTDALLKGTVGTAYNFTLYAGGTTPITWTAEGLPDGFTLNPSGKISGSPQKRGTFEVKITAANSAGSDSKMFTLEIEQNTDKLPPKILTKTLPDAKVGQGYSFPMGAEGENITWTATFKTLTGFSITSDGVLTGTPESSGTYNIVVKAKNAVGTDYANLTLKVNPADDNAEVPVVKSSKIPDAYQGEEYSYFLEAAGTSPMTWTLEEANSLPKGLELTPDGEITGEVDTSKATTFKFNVIATNSAGSSKAKPITLKVVAKTPTFKSDALKEATWNKKYSFTLKVQNMKPTMWGIEGDLPDGVKFDKGKFSGKPTEAGEFDLTISASNGAVEISQEFTLNVKGVTPKIKGSFKKGTEGEAYKSILKATGVTPITWYFEDLPEGLDFTTDETGEVCTIEGTPEGAFNSKIQVTVENGSGDDQSYSKGMKMTIKALKPKIKTEVRDVPDGVVGQRYTCQLELSTKNAEVIWSYTGNMPEGLRLDEDTGLIEGVPEEAGENFKITVKVENANKASSKNTKVLYITIHPEGTELQEKRIDESEEPEGPEFVNGVAYYERGELTTEMLARVANADEMIAAVLPAIEVEEEGMYEFTVSLDVNAPEGGLLVWHSFPYGEDDDGDSDKAVFLDETNDVIERVPETYSVTVSAWLEPGIIYEPVIAVKISEQQ